MKTDYSIEPESEVEMEFIDMLANARDFGVESGMDPNRLRFVILVFANEVGSVARQREKTSQQASVSSPVCPECGGKIESVEVEGLGEKVLVTPCEDRVELDDLDDEVLESILED